MKICWFNDNQLGLVEGDMVSDVSAALKALPAPRYPAPRGDTLIANLAQARAEIAKVAPSAKKYPVASVRFLSPVANPTKIIGVPVNYLKHIEEAREQKDVFTGKLSGRRSQDQGLFLKSNSSLVGAGEGVKLRFLDRRSDHEMELGVIIGKIANNVSEADALNYVAGYCIALDMVVRGAEDRSFRKSIDTYSVAGPWMVTADEISDPGQSAIQSCRERRSEAGIQHRMDDHQHPQADLMGVAVVHALSRRPDHDRHLRRRVARDAGRHHALRDRENRRDGREGDGGLADFDRPAFVFGPFRHRAVVELRRTVQNLRQHEPIGRGLMAGVAIVDDRLWRNVTEQRSEFRRRASAVWLLDRNARCGRDAVTPACALPAWPADFSRGPRNKPLTGCRA